MILNLNTKNFCLLIMFFSIGILLGAIYIEYILNNESCVLCLYQRIPYVLTIFLAFLGYNSKKVLWIKIIFILFLLSSILSSYHVGIENNIFEEFSGCKSNNLSIIDKTELLESMKFKEISCKDVTFKFLGLSLATINLITSLLICFTSGYIIKNEKNK